MTNVVLLERLKLRNRHVVPLNEVFILFLANKLAIGEESRAKLPVLKFVAQFVVVGTQTQAVRFRTIAFTSMSCWAACRVK